jgi:hypothetical protein
MLQTGQKNVKPVNSLVRAMAAKGKSIRVSLETPKMALSYLFSTLPYWSFA